MLANPRAEAYFRAFLEKDFSETGLDFYDAVTRLLSPHDHDDNDDRLRSTATQVRPCGQCPTGGAAPTPLWSSADHRPVRPSWGCARSEPSVAPPHRNAVDARAEDIPPARGTARDPAAARLRPVPPLSALARVRGDDQRAGRRSPRSCFRAVHRLPPRPGREWPGRRPRWRRREHQLWCAVPPRPAAVRLVHPLGPGPARLVAAPLHAPRRPAAAQRHARRGTVQGRRGAPR